MPAGRPQRSDLAVAIGARLRALRLRHELSLGALAARSGLGKGTLSELETGLRNPTLETLFAVTTALGVPLSAALPPAPHAEARTGHGSAALPPDPHAGAGSGRGEPQPTVVGEAIEAVLVDRFADALATAEVYRVGIAAGRSQRSAPHAPGVTEHWIVHGGVLDLGADGAQTTLAPGDSTSFAGDVPHRYHARAGADVSATLVVRYPGAGTTAP